ncbi:MAG: hypothetical protein AB7I18_12500 [Candidatus Berkiella sp.]
MVSSPKKRSKDPKIAAIEAEVEATKKIMEGNIDKMLERGEKLQGLVDKTEKLKNESQVFNQNAVQLKQVMGFKNFALGLILFGAGVGALIGLYAIFAAGYGWGVLPLCTGGGAALFYLLTKPVEAIFNLYQKMHFVNSLQADKPQSLKASEHIAPVPQIAKTFHLQYQQARQEDIDVPMAQEPTFKPLRNGVKVL